MKPEERKMSEITIRDVIRAANRLTRRFRLTYKEIGNSIEEVYPQRWNNMQLKILAGYDVTPEKLIWIRAIHRQVDNEQIASNMRGIIFTLLDDLNWITLEILKLTPGVYGLDNKVNHLIYALEDYRKFIKQFYELQPK